MRSWEIFGLKQGTIQGRFLQSKCSVLIMMLVPGK